MEPQQTDKENERTVRDLMDEFMYSHAEARYTRQAVRAFRHTTEKYINPDLGQTRLTELNPEQIGQILEGLNLSALPASVVRKVQRYTERQTAGLGAVARYYQGRGG